MEIIGMSYGDNKVLLVYTRELDGKHMVRILDLYKKGYVS